MATVINPPKYDIPVLQQNDDGSVSGVGLYEVLFPSSADQPLEIKGNGNTFRWKPTELVYKDEHGMYDYIVGSSPSSLNMINNQARYARTFPDADDFFNVEENKVKHWTILNESPRPPAEYLSDTVYFGVSGEVSGMELPLGIHKQMEVNLMQFPVPYVKDIEGNNIYGFYEVIESNEGQQLFIWFEASFLKKAIYPVMIDPTIIVGSNVRTGNITELSNGWIIVGVMTGDDYFGTQSAVFYVSKDKGENFERLTTWKGNSVTAPFMVSIGTTVYAVSTRSYTAGLEFTQFDALTVGDNVSSIYTAPGTDRSYSRPDIHVDDQENLHVVWTDRDMFGNYTRQSNTKYIKGIRNLSDGTIAWGSVESVTNFTRSEQEEGRSPSVVANRYGNPIISYRYYYHPGDNNVSPSNPILNQTRVVYKQLNGQWKETTFSTNVGSDTFAFRVQNKIFITWTERVEGVSNLKISISDDDGETFTHKTIASGVSASAKMVYDRTDKLYVFYSNKYITSENLGETFSSPKTLNATPSVVYTRDDSDVIGYMYQSGTSIIFDRILLNYPPLTPTNLMPTGGESRDRALLQQFVWQFNDQDIGDSQSKYELQWREQGTTDWNTVSDNTIQTFWEAPINTFPRGVIEWRVRTYDQRGEVSPYSAIQVFVAGDKPSPPTITSPANGSELTESNPLIEWTSEGQVGYRFRVISSGNVLEEYKEENNSDTSLVLPYNLENYRDYTFELAIINSDGLWSDFTSVNVSVAFTPPAQATIQATANKASITVHISNPEPTGTEPMVVRNDVYKRIDGVFKRIATNIPPNGNFTDHTVASGELAEYRVRAWGDNGAYSDSNEVSDTITLQGVWLHDVIRNEPHHFKADGSGRDSSWQAGATNLQFAGRTRPVTYFGEHETETVTVTLQMFKEWGDHAALNRIVKAKNTVCYRDGRGRRIFGTITALPFTDTIYGYETTITITATSYSEVV